MTTFSTFPTGWDHGEHHRKPKLPIPIPDGQARLRAKLAQTALDNERHEQHMAINRHQMLSTLHSSLAAQKKVQAGLAWQHAEQQRQAVIDEQKARIREVYERKVEQLANAQRMRSNFSSPYAPASPLLSPRLEQLALPRGESDRALDRLDAFTAHLDLPGALPPLATEPNPLHMTDREQGASLLKPVDVPTLTWLSTTPRATSPRAHPPRATTARSKAGTTPRQLPSSPRHMPQPPSTSPRNIAADPAAATFGIAHSAHHAAHKRSSTFADAIHSPRGPGTGPGSATNGQMGTAPSPCSPPTPFSPPRARAKLNTVSVDTRTLDPRNALQSNGYAPPTVRVVSYVLGSSDSPRGCPPGRPPRTAPAAAVRRIALGSPRAQAEGERGADRWISPRVVPASSPMAVPEHPGLS